MVGDTIPKDGLLEDHQQLKRLLVHVLFVEAVTFTYLSKGRPNQAENTYGTDMLIRLDLRKSLNLI